jgi:hypothetical protein
LAAIRQGDGWGLGQPLEQITILGNHSTATISEDAKLLNFKVSLTEKWM